MPFIAIALFMSVLVAAAIVWPVLRKRAGRRDVMDSDMQVFRDQLAEVDRDAARGLLDPDEEAQARLEISRRILAADKRASSRVEPGKAPRGLNVATLLGVTALLIGGTMAIYVTLGATGAPDQPLAQRRAALAAAENNRPDQAEAEARVGDLSGMVAKPDQQYIALIEQLRATVNAHPDDIEGLKLLSQHEARLGNFSAAHEAKARFIYLRGDQATAGDFTDLAELMIIAAGGYVSPGAETALNTALSLDPADGRARYYSGLYLAQAGRSDLAFRIWMQLLEAGPEDAPWIAPIRAQIADVAQRAGRSPPPQTLPGPDRQEIEDAAGLSDADRQSMIQRMVGKLADRLATEGGSAESWARLIRAYGVLGETGKAKQTWLRAKSAFENDNAALLLLKNAATDAGAAQ